uniref:Uncharacterized protein n=1 Tax=Candidatus Kentrum sp. UNK TaxID=2126344 RepID=A0A451AWY8_9GAMM|nr:MAG: hypothetical protein BECKUNK1418H_GA0071006_10328 [Candidatus Kentron sp. UNK]
MNRVSLRSDLEIKPKFNDPVIPVWIRHSREGGNGIQRHGWRLNSKEVFVTGFPRQWNDASLCVGRVVVIEILEKNTALNDSKNLIHPQRF